MTLSWVASAGALNEMVCGPSTTHVTDPPAGMLTSFLPNSVISTFGSACVSPPASWAVLGRKPSSGIDPPARASAAGLTFPTAVASSAAPLAVCSDTEGTLVPLATTVKVPLIVSRWSRHIQR